MNVVLFDPSHRDDGYPFSKTRPVADFRIGIGSIRDSWERILGKSLRIYTDSVLTTEILPPDALWINAALIPNPALWSEIYTLRPGEAFFEGEVSLAYYGDAPYRRRTLLTPAKFMRYPWELVQWNDEVLRMDYDLLTAGRISAPIPPGNQAIHPERIFLEEGALVSCSILNASTGPIYIGRNAEVMEGCMLRGPIALGEGSVLKMGARVYGATSLGPRCMAGGEVKNVIMMGYSNKAHDGYLGDSLIGEWCNLGAGTSNSNIRNNATAVRIWNPGKGRAEVAGPKAGLLMGDYSRAAIQSVFNTGAVVGVCCNVFGGTCSGYLPDFSWGLQGTRYDWDKALRDINNWKKLKGASLTPREIQILQPIFAAI